MPLKFLFIFDDSIDLKGLAKFGFPEESEVALFPLSGDWNLIRKVEFLVHSQKVARIVLLKAANLVDSKASALCRTLPEWSAWCGTLRIGRKTVREHFLLPGGGPSTFWFGALSEKNPLKTDSFLLLAQTQAVEEEVQEGDYDSLVLAVRFNLLRKSVGRIAEKKRVGFQAIDDSSHPLKIRNRSGVGWTICRAVGGWFQNVGRALMARFVMGSASLRMPERDSLLLVTYFPYLDKHAAVKGKFRNKYFEPLQEILQDRGDAIFWILIFIYVEGGSFRNALETAKKLARKGEKMIFLEEFFGFKEMLSAFFLWLVQVVRYFFLEKKLDEETLCGGVFSLSCTPIIRDLWRRSFCGLEAMRGLVNYLAFLKAFENVPQQKRCIYCCEMQAWEKAMLSAGHRVCSGMDTIGYQHTSVSRNYLFYVHSSSEMATRKMDDGLPLPDTLASNGRLSQEWFSRCGYEEPKGLEAIRYQTLLDVLAGPPRQPGDPPVLLLVGSIVVEETKALISLIHAAMPLPGQWEIWLKGHPSMPIAGILREMAVDTRSVCWNIKEGNISLFLDKTDVAVVPTSSVAVEALAYGCEVIVPVSSSFFPMSPLAGFDHTHSTVHSPEELKTVLERYLCKGPKMNLEEKRAFVQDYWLLDSNLPRWRGILGG